MSGVLKEPGAFLYCWWNYFADFVWLWALLLPFGAITTVLTVYASIPLALCVLYWFIVGLLMTYPLYASIDYGRVMIGAFGKNGWWDKVASHSIEEYEARFMAPITVDSHDEATLEADGSYSITDVN